MADRKRARKCSESLDEFDEAILDFDYSDEEAETNQDKPSSTKKAKKVSFSTKAPRDLG